MTTEEMAKLLGELSAGSGDGYVQQVIEVYHRTMQVYEASQHEYRAALEVMEGASGVSQSANW